MNFSPSFPLLTSVQNPLFDSKSIPSPRNLVSEFVRVRPFPIIHRVLATVPHVFTIKKFARLRATSRDFNRLHPTSREFTRVQITPFPPGEPGSVSSRTLGFSTFNSLLSTLSALRRPLSSWLFYSLLSRRFAASPPSSFSCFCDWFS